MFTHIQICDRIILSTKGIVFIECRRKINSKEERGFIWETATKEDEVDGNVLFSGLGVDLLFIILFCSRIYTIYYICYTYNLLCFRWYTKKS